MVAPSIFDAVRHGKSKAEVNRNKQSYTQTFTSVLDYPRKAPEPDMPSAEASTSALPPPVTSQRTQQPPPVTSQRTQRKAKSNAITKMDYTRERENTVPPSGSSLSSGPDKSATPKASLLPSASSNLTSVGSTNATNSEVPTGPHPSNNPILKKAHIEKAPALDRKSVRWSGPRVPKPSTRPRQFGIKECPTFYPTADEFRDPMDYLREVGEEGRGKEFGMCKIVPPEGWQMPFVLDTEIFRFQTRLQRLNSLEASSRAKLNFLDQLYMFHKQQGNPNVTIPILEHRPVDIWALRKAVNKAGGMATVSANRGWGEIAKALGYSYPQTPHVKSAYLKIVQPFDDFYTSVKASPMNQRNHSNVNVASPLTPLPGEMDPPPSTSSKSLLGNGEVSATPSRVVGNTERLGSPVRAPQSDIKLKIPRTSDSAEPARPRAYNKKVKVFNAAQDEDLAKDIEAVENAMLSEPAAFTDEAIASVQKRKRKLDALNAPATPPPKKANNRNGRMGFVGGGGAGPNEVFVQGDACEVCRSGNDGTKLLLCDECDRGFHIYCLDPPLSKVPMNEEWFCPSCLLGTGNDYGFDVGQDHSLHSFQERALAFKHEYFKTHPPASSHDMDNETSEDFGDIKVSEAEVEREFWRLVENEYETVEVEYGADIHSITHGSAAPTLETHPTSPWSSNPWNLNNLPILPQSLLRYIRSDISGMTVPWAYIGMLFAAFCWHNEDHYTYSVNYMYWGSTKTWYGIPGAHAERFEETIMQEAPELFEQQPGLLYQLVTMMNPGRLQKMGVDVFACDQRPNEFVITFPKAYHCGFNHGLNFNEAVNFALPDWLAFGKECVTRYQLHCKPPVFSHEELLTTISHFSDSIETAIWLDAALSETIDTEIRKRDELRSAAIHLGETIDISDKTEEQYTCCVCKAFCYLSQVTCHCTNNVTCLDHAASVCKCPISQRILRKRISDDQLRLLKETVHERAMIPTKWKERFHAMLAESPRPPAKALRSALQEAEKIAYAIPELVSLRPFVAAVNAWIVRANKLLNRKKSIKKRGRRSNDDMDDMDEDDGEKGSAVVVQDLIKGADALGFDAPEAVQLRHLASSISEFQSRARATLAAAEDDLNLKEVEGILLIGEALPVDLPEAGQLRKLVNRLKWMAEMNELDEAFLELKDVIDYVDRSRSCEVPQEHEFVRNLEMKLENGKDWLATAERLIDRNDAPDVPTDEPPIQVEDLDELLRQDVDRPVVGEVMGKLGVIKTRVQSAQATLRSITSLAGHPKRGTIMQVQKAFAAAKAKAGAIDLSRMDEWRECEAALEQYQQWLNLLKQAFGLSAETSNTEAQDILYQGFESVVTLLDPEDDTYTQPEVEMLSSGKTIYHAKLTCVCRRKAGPKMVQCRHCSELYHPGCLSMDPSETPVDRKIKCTFCKVKDFMTLRDPKAALPSITKFIPLIDENTWSFRYPVDEQDTVKSIIETAVRVSKIVLPLAMGEPDLDVDPELVVQYWIRKLQHVPFEIELRKPDAEDVVQLYPALINKLKVLRKKIKSFPADQQTIESVVNVRFSKNWPTLMFKRWVPGDRKLRCICTEKPKDSIVHLACSRCDQLFHASCVAAPEEALGCDGKPWACPFCTINDGIDYPYAEIRSQLPEHFGTPIFVDGPETIRRGLHYVTRLEPNVLTPSDRPMIHLEVTTFYADAPVVPGSIARAVERVGNGEVPPLDTALGDRGIRNDAAAQRPVVSGTPKAAVASVEPGHAVRPRTSQELPRAMSFRRDQPQARPPYTPSYAAGPGYQPSTAQPYESTISPSLAALQDRSLTPNSRIPPTLPRNEEEAVYRRMNGSESHRGNVWHRPEVARDPRQQPRIADRNIGPATAGNLPPPSATNIKMASMAPRQMHQPRPQQQLPLQQPMSARGVAAPVAVAGPPPRGGLIQPLPPSQFTAQMHIPAFRTGVGQE